MFMYHLKSAAIGITIAVAITFVVAPFRYGLVYWQAISIPELNAELSTSYGQQLRNARVTHIVVTGERAEVYYTEAGEDHSASLPRYWDSGAYWIDVYGRQVAYRGNENEADRMIHTQRARDIIAAALFTIEAEHEGPTNG